MAARRLLIVMLVLLGASTLAAAFIPNPNRGETTEETVTEQTQPPPPDRAPAGDVREVELKIEEKTKVIKAELGDRLALTISSGRAGLLEIPALGLVRAVAPGAPARFDLLPHDPGSYGIRFLDEDRVVARIEVAKGR